MPRVKNVMSKVYKSPRRPFEKERLDQVCAFIRKVLLYVMLVNKKIYIFKYGES